MNYNTLFDDRRDTETCSVNQPTKIELGSRASGHGDVHIVSAQLIPTWVHI